MSNQTSLAQCDHSYPYFAPPTDFQIPVPTFCPDCQSLYGAIPDSETKNAFINRNEIISRAFKVLNCVDEDDKCFLLGLENQLYLTSEEQAQFDEITNPILHLLFPDESEMKDFFFAQDKDRV